MKSLSKAVAVTTAAVSLAGCARAEQAQPQPSVTPSVNPFELLADLGHLTPEQIRIIQEQFARNRAYWVQAGTSAVAASLAKTELVVLSDNATLACNIGNFTIRVTALSGSRYCPGGPEDTHDTVVITASNMKADKLVPFAREADLETGHEIGHVVEDALGMNVVPPIADDPKTQISNEVGATCFAGVAIASHASADDIAQIEARLRRMHDDPSHGPALRQEMGFEAGATTGHC